MPNYIYLPVGTGEMAEFSAAVNDRLRANGRPEWVIISNNTSGSFKSTRRAFNVRMLSKSYGFGKLAGVAQTDTLMIVIHGGGNDEDRTTTVAANRNMPHLAMANSSGQMEYWDRTTRAGTGELHTAADDWKSYDPAALARHLDKEGLLKTHQLIKLFACNSGKEDTGGDSFAKDLQVAMKVRGYNNLTVEGYIGELNTFSLTEIDGRASHVGGGRLRAASIGKKTYS